MRKSRRKFRDHDFLRTTEGFLFCVVGPFHPPNRVISYVKYVPSKLGKWGRGKRRFRRTMQAYTISSLLNTFNRLEKRYPHYLFYSPFYNILMTAVPLEYIARHYKPEEKLARIFQISRLDGLQKKLKRFVSLVSKKSGVPLESFGVTGSILLHIHQPFSDLDVTVYGLKNSLAVKKALTDAYSSWKSAIQRFEDKAFKGWCRSKVRSFPLTFDETRQIYQRRWNIGVFEGTRFSVHPVKLEEELTQKYADKIYEPVDPIVMSGVVEENAESMFLPSVYLVKDLKIIKGPQVTSIREVVSYEGLYSDIAEIGETILVKGKLEKVHNTRTKQNYHRVLVGSPEGKGKEYIKLV
jgi:predicted nucleotidyltransferase